MFHNKWKRKQINLCDKNKEDFNEKYWVELVQVRFPFTHND